MQNLGITECKAIKISEIDNNRYIDCADYDDCLSEAAKKNFRSFHCNNCHAFQAYKKARQENIKYDICTPRKKLSVQRFFPDHLDLYGKNTGTIWND